MFEKLSGFTANIPKVTVVAVLFCLIGQISASAQTACARLDVKALSVPPGILVAGDRLDLIERFLDQTCAPSAEARLIDLSFLQLKLALMPPPEFTRWDSKFDRVQSIKDDVRRAILKSPPLRPNVTTFSSHDIAVAMFSGCQYVAALTHNPCPADDFDNYEAAFKDAPHAIKVKKVGGMVEQAIETARKKR